MEDENIADPIIRMEPYNVAVHKGLRSPVGYRLAGPEANNKVVAVPRDPAVRLVREIRVINVRLGVADCTGQRDNETGRKNTQNAAHHHPTCGIATLLKSAASPSPIKSTKFPA